MNTENESLWSKEMHDVELEIAHMDQETYCDTMDGMKQRVKEADLMYITSMNLLRNKDRELKTLKSKLDAQDLEIMHLYRRKDELSRTNEHLQEKIDNLEWQLRCALQELEDNKSLAAEVLFDQDLKESFRQAVANSEMIDFSSIFE